MKSVFVGMRNANVRNELRESCKTLYKDPDKADKDDDLFMFLISEAVANETARAERMKEAKEAEVNLMQTNVAEKEKVKRPLTLSKESEKTIRPSPLAQIDELRIQQESQGQTLTALAAQVVEICDVLVGGDRPNQAVPSVPVQPQSVSTGNQPVRAALPLMQAPQTTQNFTPQQQNQSHNNQNMQNIPRNPAPLQYQPYIPPHRRRSKCEKCERENRYRCFHCFHCGSGNHRIFECPTKN